MKKTPASPALPLVIVESPNKLKSISKILGENFNVKASYGHFADIPAKRNAIDVDNGFAATYELSSKGREVIEDLADRRRFAARRAASGVERAPRAVVPGAEIGEVP